MKASILGRVRAVTLLSALVIGSLGSQAFFALPAHAQLVPTMPTAPVTPPPPTTLTPPVVDPTGVAQVPPAAPKAAPKLDNERTPTYLERQVHKLKKWLGGVKSSGTGIAPYLPLIVPPVQVAALLLFLVIFVTSQVARQRRSTLEAELARQAPPDHEFGLPEGHETPAYGRDFK